MNALSRSLFLLALTGVAPALADAQTGNPAETAKIHLGPVGVTPGITVSSGVDSNVFAEEVNPKSDMVMVVNPRVQLWFRARRLIVEVRNTADAVTFMRYQSQSGFGMNNEVRVEMPLNRVRLLATNTFLTTPQRANFEIDTRARRQTTTLSLGADIKASSKTYLRFTGSRSSTEFDEEAFNEGVSLSQSLNRRMGVAGAAWRYQITGATTLAMSADVTREEFEVLAREGQHIRPVRAWDRVRLARDHQRPCLCRVSPVHDYQRPGADLCRTGGVDRVELDRAGGHASWRSGEPRRGVLVRHQDTVLPPWWSGR